MVPVMVPAQLSVVAGAVKVVEHSAVTADKTGVTGSVISSMITVCGAVTTFPIPSSKVQVMVYVP